MMARAWMILFMLALVLAYWAFEIAAFLVVPASTVPAERVVEVRQGMTLTEVSELLRREQVVANALYFRIVSRWTKTDKRLQAGEFALNTAMRPLAVLDVMTQGKNQVAHVVTIPEGVTIRQIGEILHAAGRADAAQFAVIVGDPALIEENGGTPLEGYLFPTTYTFVKGIAPIEIVRRMLTQFQTVYDDALQRRAEAIGFTRHEVVTLASIIEKETMQPSERVLVSAVFHNRLRQGMRLQSDPTVIFGLPQFNGNITRADLETPTPYNTYLINGLPQGPIGNPGRESLQAALYPADVDYLFFVAKGDGTHAFSRTLAEHNKAVAVYQLRQAGGR